MTEAIQKPLTPITTALVGGRWVLDRYIRLEDLLCYVGVNTYMIETQLPRLR